MLKKFTASLPILFWLLAILDILCITFNKQPIHSFIKPLLMPVLILLVFSNKHHSNKGWIIAGLIFSFVGDVLLLFDQNNSLFFILGLAAFLITHICYIVWLLKIKSGQQSLLSKQPWLAAIVVAYCVGLVYILYPGLGDLKMPVMIYAVVIGCMLLCSMHVFYKVGAAANGYLIAGALLFVLSDSILAISKFLSPFLMSNVLIMLTYCAAQFFIVRGYTILSNQQVSA